MEAQALLYAGHVEEVRSHIEQRRAWVAQSPRLRIPQIRSEAVLAHYEHRYTDALNHLTEALGLAEQIGLPAERWQISAEIAENLEALGRMGEATQYRAQAIQIVGQLADKIPNPTMRQTYLEFTHQRIHAKQFPSTPKG